MVTFTRREPGGVISGALEVCAERQNSQWASKLDKLSTSWAGRGKASPTERKEQSQRYRDFYVGPHGHVGKRQGLKLQRGGSWLITLVPMSSEVGPDPIGQPCSRPVTPIISFGSHNCPRGRCAWQTEKWKLQRESRLPRSHRQ